MNPNRKERDIYYDTSSNFHPFECDGKGKCVHCDRVTVTGSNGMGDVVVTHDPATCSLCDPDYDMQPNELWEGDAA